MFKRISKLFIVLFCLVFFSLGSISAIDIDDDAPSLSNQGGGRSKNFQMIILIV